MSSAYTEQDLRKQFDAAWDEAAKREGYARGDWYKGLREAAWKATVDFISRIRSEARAGMREACATQADNTPFRCHSPKDIEFHSGCVQTRDAIVSAIRKLPDLAAEEALERIKREARLEEFDIMLGHLLAQDWNIQDVRNHVDKRIATLTVAAKESKV